MDEPDLGRYYDLKGHRISFETWAKMMNARRADRREENGGWSTPEDDPTRVGFDKRGDVSVSTVWLGLDHQWGDGPPLIFETMIFGGEHDQEQWRYSTREAAEAGHAAAVKLAFAEIDR